MNAVGIGTATASKKDKYLKNQFSRNLLSGGVLMKLQDAAHAFEGAQERDKNIPLPKKEGVSA